MAARTALLGLDLSVRIALLGLQHLLVFCWVRYVVAPASAGRSRFLCSFVALPVILFSSYLFDPNDDDEFSLTLYCSSNCAWLTAMKLWTFCLKRGPLVKAYETRNNGAFAVSLLFPVLVAYQSKNSKKKDKPAVDVASPDDHAFEDVSFSVLPLTWKQSGIESGKIVMQLFINAILAFFWGLGYEWADRSGHTFWKNTCASWVFYCACTRVEKMIGLVIMLTLRLELTPSFDRPWQAQSMTEVWSRRYNLAVGSILRESIYNPICEGRWVLGMNFYERPKASPVRKFVALIAVFVLSALFHGWFAMQAFDIDFPYTHVSFFYAICFVVIVERLIKALSKQTGIHDWFVRSVPPVVLQCYTVIVFLCLAQHLYWREATAMGLDKKFIKDFASLSNRN